MKPLNEFKLAFQSSSSNESFARIAVSGFLAQYDPTVDELSDIKTVVSEAVTNCIVHAYRNHLATVYITVKYFDGDRVTISVRDVGCGIPDVKQAMEPLFSSDPGGERAGLGFTVMQSFMDKISVRSKPGRGTTVTLTKRFAKRTFSND